GDFFSIAFTWDVTYKGQPRGGWKEIGIYRVKKSKIISEQYFY
ncbi:MAG: SnoaL-like domain-containing protein, partial [Chryseotalea sp.]